MSCMLVCVSDTMISVRMMGIATDKKLLSTINKIRIDDVTVKKELLVINQTVCTVLVLQQSC